MTARVLLVQQHLYEEFQSLINTVTIILLVTKSSSHTRGLTQEAPNCGGTRNKLLIGSINLDTPFLFIHANLVFQLKRSLLYHNFLSLGKINKMVKTSFLLLLCWFSDWDWLKRALLSAKGKSTRWILM